MDGAKTKIRQYVESYKEVFSGEFRSFMQAQKPKLDDLAKSNKYAEVKGSDVVERQLGEMPETLFLLLQKNLTAQEYIWYQSMPGQAWFFNTFTEFKVTGGRI